MRKGWWRLWFPHKSGWDSGRKINKRGQRSPNKKKRKKRPKKGKAQKKRERPQKREKAQKTANERKREKGQCYYPFTTLVLQSSTMIFMIESLLRFHFHILVGIFIIEHGLYIPIMGFLKCPRSSWASKLDAHPLRFSLSFHTLIALVHPLHGNPYSLHWHQLMGISIARWLAASMWDFLPFLSSPHNPPHYILFHP